MTPQTKTALALTLLLAVPTAFAQNRSDNKNQKETTEVIKIERQERPPIGRPKIPSQQHIECVYTEGTLHFFFAFPDGECLMTVTDSFSGISTQYSFDSAEPAEIFVGEIQAGSIEIQTSLGYTYEGTIS